MNGSKPASFSSLLSNLRGRARTGATVARTRARDAGYDSLDMLEKGVEAYGERVSELDDRELRRGQRMGRGREVGAAGGAWGGAKIGGSVGGPVGALLGSVLGALGGSWAGSEFGEHLSFNPGKLFEGIAPGGKPWKPGDVLQSRAPAGQIAEFNEPIKFHSSKKAQLNKKINDMNRLIKRTQKDMNVNQWSNATSDALNTFMYAMMTNPKMVSSYNDYLRGTGDFSFNDFFTNEMWQDSMVANIGGAQKSSADQPPYPSLEKYN